MSSFLFLNLSEIACSWQYWTLHNCSRADVGYAPFREIKAQRAPMYSIALRSLNAFAALLLT